MTAVRAIVNGERGFEYSLHYINGDYDSGAVIDIRTTPINYTKFMLGFMDYAYPVSVEMALDAMERFARGEELPAIEQDQAKSRYYSFPSAGDLEVTRRNPL